MPSMTSTRASPVARSRITGAGRRYRASVGGRSARGRAAGGRRRAARRGAARCAVPAREKAEKTPLGGQHKRGVAAVEALAIGLQRAVEDKELLVLAERVAIELYRLRVAVATHPLGVALRLGEDDGAFALGVGAHVLRRF